MHCNALQCFRFYFEVFEFFTLASCVLLLWLWEKEPDIVYINPAVSNNSASIFSFHICYKESQKSVLKGEEYLTIPLNAVKHRYFMVSTNGEYFVKLSRILTCAPVFLYFDVAQYFHIWRQTMRRQLPYALYSPLYWTSTQSSAPI